ncbi:MAG TPA: M20/M25/M40 family metallo-hydrolase [Gemmatimonadaceae bacterium]|nr:M20/M25/M40 family metallo-hydrolase [Gemmatimonadaceae bacterium]
MRRFRTSAARVATLSLIALGGASAQTTTPAGEKIDYATLARIRDEGLQRSQAMEHMSWLADVYGPRLTGSTGIRRAADWAKRKMGEWGLTNVHEEPFAFGKGWELVRFHAHMIEPQVMPIIGMPKSWTPGTNGTVQADVVLAPISTPADFEKYRSKLRGKIVLTQPARAVRMLDGRIVLHMNEDDVAEAQSTPVPPARGGAGGGRGGGGQGQQFAQRVAQFYQAEGALALIDRGSDSDESAGGSDLSWRTQRVDGGTIFVGSGGPRDENAGKGLPSIVAAVEHYNRMVRILERNVPVKMELHVETRFLDEPAGQGGFNIVAEIPGTDPRLKDEVVMLGAHFDSHHGATGATDNATGSVAMMEAMRILKAAGVRPRRTIRVALWGAEEQGLIGSRAYVRQHFADPATMQTRPEYDKLSAYFNLDNGTGKIRGIWYQGNLGVRHVFEQWIEPLEDLGVEILGPRMVGSTDHAPFEAVGLPGFQFVQERLEYNSRTHHSNMDFVDRVQREDLVQQATVAAAFAFMAAQRDEKLPRKAKPEPRGVTQD